MTPSLALWLAVIGLGLAGPGELELERSRAALDQGRGLDARRLALEGLAAGAESAEGWSRYVSASEAAGLGAMAHAELEAAAAVSPELAAYALVERVRAGQAELGELEDLARENPELGRAWLAELTWQTRGPTATEGLLGADAGERATRVRIRSALRAGDVRGAAGLARGWQRKHPQAPDVLAELWLAPTTPDGLALVQRRSLKRLAAARGGNWDDPLWLYRAVDVLSAAGEHIASRELAARIGELGLEPPAYRMPWGGAMLEGMGRVFGMRSDPEVPDGSWREVLVLTRARVDHMRKTEAYDDALAVWEALRAAQDGAEAALEHGRLLQQLEREEAWQVALEARELAAGPTPDDQACLQTAEQAARLADAHGLLAELALARGLTRSAAGAVAVAQALDPHPRWLALGAHVRALPDNADDPGLPRSDRVLAVVDTIREPTRAEAWLRRAEAHERAGERHAAFASWVVGRAHGAEVGDGPARTWDGPGSAELAAEAALQAFHAHRREHRQIIAALREEETGAAPIELTAVAPGAGLLLPSWEAVASDGTPLSSEALSGQPYVLSVWATWCLPCLEELPVLNREVRLLGADGRPVRAIAISVDERQLTFERRAQAAGWNSLTLGWNPDLAQVLGVDGLPTNFAVDAEGRILHLERGYSDRGVARLLEAVGDADH